VKIQNVTENVLVIGTAAEHIATLKPGEHKSLPDEKGNDPTISTMVNSGWLKTYKDDQPVSAIETPVRVAQNVVSLIKDREIPIRTAGAVSLLKDTRDSSEELPSNEETLRQSSVKIDASGKIQPLPEGMATVGDGSMLIKMGGKTKPAGIVNVAALKADKTKIIKTKATSKELNLDTANMGQVFINPSGIPGQGKLMNISDLSDDQLEMIRQKTTEMVEGAKRDRKLMQIVNNYQDLEAEKRRTFIEDFDDPEILATMLKLEKSPALVMKIKAKLRDIAPEMVAEEKPVEAPAEPVEEVAEEKLETPVEAPVVEVAKETGDVQ